MDNHFDYHSTFFRRPYWTESNRRFVKFWSGTTAVILLLQLVFMNISRNIPVAHIEKQIVQHYFSTFLSELSLAEEVTEQPQPETAERAEKAEVDFSRMRDREVVEHLLNKRPANRTRLSVEKFKQKFDDPSLDNALEEIVHDKTQHFKLLTSIISDVPPLATPPSEPAYSPLESIFRRREIANENLKMFKQKASSEVNIKPPEITDFGLVKGYRNYEQTLRISNGNLQLIRYCLEKFVGNMSLIKGNIVVKFEIHPDGYVVPESIKIIETDIRDPRALACIQKRIRRWRNFPKVALEQGNYTITQKYIF